MVAFAIRCQDAGHQVKVWFPETNEVGNGWINKVPSWQAHMNWAELIVVSMNAQLGNQLEPYFKKGYPIMGANKKGAEIELDRGKGQDIFEKSGIETLPYQNFNDFNKAMDFVKGSSTNFVVKPWGGEADKSLSYVPPKGFEEEGMLYHLEWCKKNGIKGEFVLQECVRGIEVGVSGWFGPGGFSKWIEEDFEEKKLLAGGYGCATGEEGTTVRHVKESKLFDMLLKPLEPYLHQIGYVGNININSIIDMYGHPWPLEATCRIGVPDFHIILPLMEEPCEWMADLIYGSDTLRMSEKIGIGVVISHGEYPYCDFLDKSTIGVPVFGWKNDKNFQPCMMRKGKTWPETAGAYVAVICGQGDTVEEAQKAAYGRVKQIKMPSNMMCRIDIGERLEDQIPKLQRFGYCTGMVYGEEE